MGFVGTAESRLNDADEAGLIRVKTGSLGDVTSMTGNVSRLNGGALTFAVIVNNPTDFAAANGHRHIRGRSAEAVNGHV